MFSICSITELSNLILEETLYRNPLGEFIFHVMITNHTLPVLKTFLSWYTFDLITAVEVKLLRQN